MPRIYDPYLDPKTGKYEGAGGDPLDYCRHCWPPDLSKLPNVKLADCDYGDDGDDHPPYNETEYRCETCGKPLTADDD